MNDDKSKFATWKPQGTQDVPGQLDITGQYIVQPDDACAKNAKPLTAPERGPLPKVKEIHLRLSDNDAVKAQWYDKEGNPVTSDNKHPYTGEKH